MKQKNVIPGVITKPFFETEESPCLSLISKERAQGVLGSPIYYWDGDDKYLENKGILDSDVFIISYNDHLTKEILKNDLWDSYGKRLGFCEFYLKLKKEGDNLIIPKAIFDFDIVSIGVETINGEDYLYVDLDINH